MTQNLRKYQQSCGHLTRSGRKAYPYKEVCATNNKFVLQAEN